MERQLIESYKPSNLELDEYFKFAPTIGLTAEYEITIGNLTGYLCVSIIMEKIKEKFVIKYKSSISEAEKDEYDDSWQRNASFSDGLHINWRNINYPKESDIYNSIEFNLPYGCWIDIDLINYKYDLFTTYNLLRTKYNTDYYMVINESCFHSELKKYICKLIENNGMLWTMLNIMFFNDPYLSKEMLYAKTINFVNHL